MRPLVKNLAQRAFLAGDRVGVHLMPSHYYSSVASRKALRRIEVHWRRPLAPLPFEWDLDKQSHWLRANAETFGDEITLSDILATSEAVGGFRYGPIEAQFLYGYLRANAPRRIVEIGSGSSTLLMSMAVERNVADGKNATTIIAFDPYTAGNVTHLPHVEARQTGGLDNRLGDLDLQSGDLLFIDSTHTVRTGSELAHLYLEILPNLAPGVIAHIHDIYLPYLFSPDVYQSMFDWQETTLVAALLTGKQEVRNPGVHVRGSFMNDRKFFATCSRSFVRYRCRPASVPARTTGAISVVSVARVHRWLVARRADHPLRSGPRSPRTGLAGRANLPGLSASNASAATASSDRRTATSQ